MILLRHGQSEFNLHFTRQRRDPGIADPRLTPLGHAQAEQAAAALAGAGCGGSSSRPIRGRLQTAAPLARALGVPVLVNPLVRERYAFTCDVGTPRTELALRLAGAGFSAIRRGLVAAGGGAVRRHPRPGGAFRAEMAALPDWSDTLVVSHWGFILAMTGERIENGEWLRCDPTAPAPERRSTLGYHWRWRRAGNLLFRAPLCYRRPVPQHPEKTMSDATATPPADAAPQVPPLVVNIQYVKDLSFEVPGAPPDLYPRFGPRRGWTSTSTSRPAG